MNFPFIRKMNTPLALMGVVSALKKRHMAQAMRRFVLWVALGLSSVSCTSSLPVGQPSPTSTTILQPTSTSQSVLAPTVIVPAVTASAPALRACNPLKNEGALRTRYFGGGGVAYNVTLLFDSDCSKCTKVVQEVEPATYSWLGTRGFQRDESGDRR